MPFLCKKNCMQVVILAGKEQKEELLSPSGEVMPSLTWIEQPEEFLHYPEAGMYADLLFTNTSERIDLLRRLLPKTVIINSVLTCLSEINLPFTRINGWPGFLKNEKLEAVVPDSSMQKEAALFFALFSKTPVWCPDTTGFISPRVIAMIINEAYLALEENVSTKKEIDTAMKLGTNYPYGPFEWAEKIGIENIGFLLARLSESDKKYQPAGLLIKEARNL